MNFIRTTLIVFLVILLNTISNGQNGKGYMLVAISPDDAIIRIDTALFVQKKSHMVVDTGTYVIRAWAPKTIMITDTIRVTEGRSVLFRKKLEYTDEYKKHRKALHAYNMKKYVPATVTVCASLFYIGMYGKFYKDAKDNYLDKALESKAAYENATDINEILAHKESYNSYKSKYDKSIDKANKTLNQAKIVIPVAAAVTGVMFYYSLRLTKPVFKETPMLSNMTFDYELLGQTPGPRVNFNVKF
ncbi:MAG: hypothetical protein IPL74_08915 [Bacteroidetes bacterium]|nr:hypothetical protein [Bacteroidota bacterium]